MMTPVSARAHCKLLAARCVAKRVLSVADAGRLLWRTETSDDRVMLLQLADFGARLTPNSPRTAAWSTFAEHVAAGVDIQFLAPPPTGVAAIEVMHDRSPAAIAFLKGYATSLNERMHADSVGRHRAKEAFRKQLEADAQKEWALRLGARP